MLAVRQREQSPIIQKIGDVFLSAAAEFRAVYPVYVGNLPLAEKRLREEMERNNGFKLWLDVRILNMVTTTGRINNSLFH